jgi:MFS family permease
MAQKKLRDAPFMDALSQRYPRGSNTDGQLLSATTQTIAWCVIFFFFASAAASSAYLTASGIFPLETRALAIACFYALGTALGGATSPLLFGWLIESGSA